MCHMSHAMCRESHVTCHISYVIFTCQQQPQPQTLPMLTPPLCAHMHSRLVCKNPNQEMQTNFMNFFKKNFPKKIVNCFSILQKSCILEDSLGCAIGNSLGTVFPGCLLGFFTIYLKYFEVTLTLIHANSTFVTPLYYFIFEYPLVFSFRYTP